MEQELDEKIYTTKDSPWIYVRESKVHNKGIFASKDIPKGTRIIEYVGEKITSEVSEERMERDYKNRRVYIFQLNDEYDIDGLVNGNESIQVNHSCDPNCEVDIIDDRIYVISLRDIKKDEELNYDYHFDFDEDTLEHPCLCGSEKCRGYIVSEDEGHKLKEFLEKQKNKQ